MSLIDPFKVSLYIAMEVLDSIDEQGEKLKEYTLAGSIGVISSLLKFIYNSCIITVGSRVFGYADK